MLLSLARPMKRLSSPALSMSPQKPRAIKGPGQETLPRVGQGSQPTVQNRMLK